MSYVDKHARSFGESLFAPLNGVMSFSGGGEFDAITLQNSYNEALPVVYFGTTSPETSGIVQSVASLTSFANSGTHFAFPTTFPNGWH